MDKLLALLLLLSTASLAAKRTIIQWSSFECIENPEIVTYHRCFIVNPPKTIITGEIEYNRGFQQYNAKIALYLPRPPFKEFYKVVDLTLDICQFFSGAYKNNLIKVAYNSMMKHSNMPKKCPQPKGFYYYPNMSIGDNLQPFLPKYEFKVQLDFFLPNVPMFNVSLSGRLTDYHRVKKS
ncbi:uncharacterized protein LOC115565746 [Drosophila navojoa]|uniref:uncharacterized protein LOC115565746 n=1 Tax=Drosophila navojoa TaxID=7232 RepID=UPI0011BEF9B4|nr:uncharacterized protein LOC115565746 [Drosophila navojoa]